MNVSGTTLTIAGDNFGAEPTPEPDKGGTSQPTSTSTPTGSTTTTPAAGTAARTTTTEVRTLPRTGDETAPLLVVLLAGAAAIAAGILARTKRDSRTCT